MLFKEFVQKSLQNVSQLRSISTSSPLDWIHNMTRLRVVDNSKLGKQAMLAGKPPKVITVLKFGKVWRASKRGNLGDKVTLVIMGQVKRGFIVGHKMHRSQVRHGVPRNDSNNVVLLEDNGNPSGTRILAPIPSTLRALENKPDFAKILAIATKFV